MLKVAIALCALLLAAAALAPVDDVVARALADGKHVDVLVQFPARGPSPVGIYKGLTRAERRVSVRRALGEQVAQYQPAVIALLKVQKAEFKSFWINNSIFIRNASPVLIQLLRRERHVVEIIHNDEAIARIHDPMIHEVVEKNKFQGALQWNILKVGADQVWANVTRGESITIANIDTGVRYTHEAVLKSYRGNNAGSFDHDYNWFDPRGQTAPYDNNGHGTHTMGTIVGSEGSGIGVAPGASWIAAKGCASSSCSNADLLASAEYVVCPTRQDGSNEDCSRGADVVSNSWGGGRGSTTFLNVIQTWVDAGSVPIFSQGNSGSSCSTANSPGDLGIVIGVGSTDIDDALSSFSSRGPGVGTANFPAQKPDVSAPGERVYSAYYTSDTAYSTLSGTSMAAPHVSGIVGLMLSANPFLSYEEIREILQVTNVQKLPAPKGGLTTCSGLPYTTYPNYHYGYGRTDAVAAVDASVAIGRRH